MNCGDTRVIRERVLPSTRALVVGLALVFLTTGPAPLASTLSNAAASLQPGHWVKIQTNFSSVERTDGYNEAQWTDSASYDKAHDKITLMVAQVSSYPYYRWTYDIPTNTFQRVNWDSEAGVSPPKSGHAYDGNTGDAMGNHGSVYFIWWDDNGIRKGTWNGSGYSWTLLPTLPWSRNIAAAAAWTPFLNNGQGGVVLASIDRAAYWNTSSSSWVDLNAPSNAFGGPHLSAEYNYHDDLLMIGGGNDHPRDAWLLHPDLSWTKTAAAPCDIRVQLSNLVYDSASNTWVLSCGTGYNAFYQYSAASNAWTHVTWASTPSVDFNWTSVAMVGLPDLGVVAAIAWDSPGNPDNGLYLFRLGTAAPECSDGFDNDGDGSTDLADSGCSGSSDTDESNCGDGVCEGGETATSCAADCGGGGTGGNEDALSVAPCAWDYPTPYSIGYKCLLNDINGVDSDHDLDSALTVRYRTTAGPGPWKTGHPGHLVLDDPTIDNGSSLPESGQYLTTKVPLRDGGHYAGVIWDLAPGTSYDVELTFTDPDGGGEVRTLTTSTRTEHPANPAAPNYPCPDGADGDGANDVCTTSAEINAAIAAASAGSVIKIAAGNYTPVAGKDQVLDLTGLTGTEENPIIIRCADQATTTLSSGSAQYAVYSAAPTGFSHVVIEDCTITGAQDYVLKLGGNITRFTFRRNHVVAAASGLFSKFANCYGFDIDDNLIDGPVQFPDRGTSAYEGIVIHGQGHALVHNTVRGAGDVIGASLVKDQTTIQHRNWYVEGNDIQWTQDDCFEIDYTYGNMVILRNRCQNAQDCFSSQAGFGGPFFFVRNVCWIGGLGLAIKIKIGTSNYGDPDGHYLYNNIWNPPWYTYSGGNSYEWHMKNNLIVGTHVSNTVVGGTINFYGRYDRGGNPPCPDVTNNAYSYDGSFLWDGCASGNSLAAVQAAGPVEQNSIIATEPIFADTSGFTPPNTYPSYDLGPTPACEAPLRPPCTTFYAIDDPRPNANSNLIDAGAVIPNVTDGYTGSSPDIGPYELGQPLVAYGVRGGTNLTPACSDGIDNDGDGLTDSADPGCSSAQDPWERGAPYQCDDGIDNDGDGAADYPADPQCTGATDDTEEDIPTDPPLPPENPVPF